MYFAVAYGAYWRTLLHHLVVGLMSEAFVVLDLKFKNKLGLPDQFYESLGVVVSSRYTSVEH